MMNYGSAPTVAFSGVALSVTTGLMIGWTMMALVLVLFLASALRQLLRTEKGPRP
jgi:hypothetical protein